MFKYAKLINGELQYAPTNKGSICNYNLDIELMKKDGYKPVTEVQLPTNDRLYKVVLKETKDAIVEQIEYLESEDEYNLRIKTSDFENQILELKFQLDVLDTKRIRAICEPEIKDKETGESWLDYYNSKIKVLRLQKQELEERMKNDITI